ncbi:MAG: hypothetical protein ACRDSF_25145 [Pseudonocardiaceae bacterium]
MSAGGREVLLEVDEADGFAIRITDGDGSGRVDPEVDPAPLLPAGVSHLLAADDALIPGRWGAHVTLCGLQVRASGAAAEDECFPDRYCPECAVEAGRCAWKCDA